MSLQDIIGQEEIIFVGPSELKDYFFESKKENPFLNFKYFTLDNLIKNLVGNYLDKEVIKLGLKTFSEYTYSLVKEVSKFCFYSLDINKSKNQKIIDFCKEIEEKGLKKLNKDFLNLIKNRKICFINYKESSYVNNFIKHYNITNFKHLEISDIIEEKLDLKYHEFFNIGDELKYALNKAFDTINWNDEVLKVKELKNLSFIFDIDRYDYYLKLFLTNLNIPYNIKKTKTYQDSEIFKDLYQKIDDSFKILSYLEENKDKYNNEEYQFIFDLLSFYEIDNLTNKKINFKEILSSQSLNCEVYKNAVEFKKSIFFSKTKNIYLLGLDNTFLPKTIKDSGLFSYDYLHENGFDSLDETNIMKNKLETAFLKQKNIVFVSYHFKDNSGKYSSSYYLDALNFKKVNNENLEKEYIEDVSKLYYRNSLDAFARSGIVSDELEEYKKSFNGKLLETFSPEFKRMESYLLNKNINYSYSNLKTLYECPFAYYVSNILNGEINEKNIYQKYGTITHAILEDVYNANFDFNKSYQKALDRYEKYYGQINEKEKKLFERFIFELKQAINTIILPHKNDMSFFRNYSEKSLSINKVVKALSFSEGDFPKISESSLDVIFKGKIDSILETSDGHLFIVDYKTGQDTFKKNDIEKHQLNLQLPTYIYLIQESNDQNLKDKPIDGVFLEKIIGSNGRFYNYLDPEEDDLTCLKYDGAFLNDYDSMLKFDHTLNEPGAKSKYVYGLMLTKKMAISRLGAGQYHALSRQELDNFALIVDKNFNECVEKIAFGSFHIQPYKKGKEYVACTFCNHSDICFKRNKIAEEE